jgi:hypothetical protein
MATGRSVVVSEVLWFINVQFLKSTKSDISAVLNSFYSSEEIVTAKKSLFDFAATMDVDYLPAYVERKGVNKQRANVDDILALYTLLDAHKVELPCYAPVESKGLDSPFVAVLTGIVNDLRQQVATLVDKVELLMDRSNSAATVHATTPSLTMLPTDGPHVQSSNSTSEVAQPTPKSWAEQAASLAGQSVVFTAPPKRLAKSGKGHSTEKVKAVPRYLTCFVGRLASDTTAEDLCEYLSDVGIKDARCRKLDDKDGVFRTAAFRVSCRDTYRDLFYDESSWPDGVEIRDWVFRKRDGERH